MPRVPPVTGKDDVAPEYGYVVDQVMEVFGRIRGPFSMLLHSPKLAERLLPMVPFAREVTVVEPQLRQIAVLAAVRERDANYVWAAQVDASRRAGLRASHSVPSRKLVRAFATHGPDDPVARDDRHTVRPRRSRSAPRAADPGSRTALAAFAARLGAGGGAGDAS